VRSVDSRAYINLQNYTAFQGFKSEFESSDNTQTDILDQDFFLIEVFPSCQFIHIQLSQYLFDSVIVNLINHFSAIFSFDQILDAESFSWLDDDVEFV